MNPDSATSSLEVEIVAGQSAATAARAGNPMKLLVPRPRGGSVWACVGSFGGGLVAGDQISLNARVKAGARCFLTTQASTKVYRNPRQRPCSYALTAEVEEDALLVLAPDPVQCFAGSTFAQSQRFQVRPTSTLILLDWFISGRAARAERWCFTRLQSRNEIFLGSDKVLTDSLLLDQSHGPLRGAYRMGRFNCLALLVLLGPLAEPAARRVLAEVRAMEVARRSATVISASPIRQGAIVRLAGEKNEEVARQLRRLLDFVPALLGDDPWARKW